MNVVRFFALASGARSNAAEAGCAITGAAGRLVAVIEDTGCAPNRTLPTPNVGNLGALTTGAVAGMTVAPGGIGGGGAVTLTCGAAAGACTAGPSANPNVLDVAGAAERVALARSVREILSSGSSAGAALQPKIVHPPFS